MAWETPGPVFERSRERLAASDVGIVLFREMLDTAIRVVETGGRPPAQGDGTPINLRRWMNGYLPMSAPADPTSVDRLSGAEVFDDRHREYDVPTRLTSS
jgi:hypothetical protein